MSIFRYLFQAIACFSIFALCVWAQAPALAEGAADITRPNKFKRVQVIPPVEDFAGFDEAKKTVDAIKLAVKEKDAAALLKYVDKDIKPGFGGEYGRAEFIKMWELDKKPRNSKIWKELETIFALGGVVEKDSGAYTAPYTFSAKMEGLDDFQYEVVIGRGVNVREKPSSASAVIKRVDYEVVYVVYNSGENEVCEEIDKESHPWKKVVLYSGERGYIYGRFVRSVIDYRLSIVKGSDGLYKIAYMVAGD